MEDHEKEVEVTLKLPLLPLTSTMHSSPEHSKNNNNFPSVPFKWEQEPGKPRPCTDIILVPPKSLLLPPCRTKSTPSPTTVLDGPNNVGRPKFSSFRFFRHSFDSGSTSGSVSPETAAVVGKKSSGGLFGNFIGTKKKDQKGVVGVGGTFVFSSPSSTITTNYEDSDEKINVEGCNKIRRNGSLSVSKSTHVWVSMYEGLKQAIPWKSTRKSNVEAQT